MQIPGVFFDFFFQKLNKGLLNCKLGVDLVDIEADHVVIAINPNWLDPN
jgi:hypothetical protein